MATHPKLKVGDKVYGHRKAEYTFGKGTLEEYEVTKVGRQYYTVVRNDWDVHHIVIATKKDKDCHCGFTWFYSMEEFEAWNYRRTTVAKIRATMGDYPEFKKLTLEELEQLLALVEKG